MSGKDEFLLLLCLLVKQNIFVALSQGLEVVNLMFDMGLVKQIFILHRNWIGFV